MKKKMNDPGGTPQSIAAKTAGIGYFIMFVAAIFSNFIVRSDLIVAAAPAATAANILAKETLFRTGIVTDLLFILPLDIVLAWALYLFFKPVERGLALLAAWFRVVYTGIYAAALLNQIIVLQLLTGDMVPAVFEAAQVDALALLFLQSFDYGWMIGFVFFGLHLGVLAYLVFRSGFIPKVIGILLILAAIAYVADSCLRILLSDYAQFEALFQTMFSLPEFIGELLLFVWIFFRGGKMKTVELPA